MSETRNYVTKFGNIASLKRQPGLSGLPQPMQQGMRAMTEKAVSKAQYRFFRAVQGGSVKAKGLSPSKAGEMLGHQSPKGLPERKRRHKVKYPSVAKPK